MTRHDSAPSSFDDIIRSGLKELRSDEPRGQDGVAPSYRGGSGRRFWAAVALLAIYWMGWGVVLTQWLFTADTTPTLHGTLLVMMAAIGVLATVMALVVSHVVEELRQAPAAAAVKANAGREVPKPGIAPRHKEQARGSKREPAGPPSPPPIAPPEPETQVIAEGEIQGRVYRHFSDGSVEISTLLGMRRFASLTDARQFIGPSDAALVH